MIENAELIRARKDEIVKVCEKLYETHSYKEITIKEIASFTSCTRSSIYNYFQTREEIFLAFLGQEYRKWVDDLSILEKEGQAFNKQHLAEGIAHSLENRGKMLKLLSMNLSEIEGNSRMESLIEFKVIYGEAIRVLKRITALYCPEKTESGINDFVFSFFPFLFGIHPYVHRTKAQIAAMDAAGTEYTLRSIYEVVYTGVKVMLSVN